MVKEVCKYLTAGAFFLSVCILLFWYIKSQQYMAPVYEKKEIILNTDKMWSIIQDWRASVNKSQYIKNESLCKIANERSGELFAITHDLFMERYANKYPSVLAENLVEGYRSEKASLHGWLSSPSHKKALEDNFKYSCVSCTGSTCVQIFSNCEGGCV